MLKRKASDAEEDADTKIQKLDYDDRQYLYKPVSSLMDTAAFNIVVALWRHQEVRYSYRKRKCSEFKTIPSNTESYIHCDQMTNLSMGRYYCHYYELNTSKWPMSVDLIVKSVDELPLPPKLRTIISDHVKLLPSFQQFGNWIFYHDHRIFFPEEVYADVASDQLDELVFKSYGQIDYLATAKNLLLSFRISELHKYRIMCTYCMEEEILQFSDFVVSSKYTDRVKFDEQPLIYYWNCYLKNELHKIDFKDAPSLASYMIGKVDNWAAIEYFFDQLDCEDQIVKAVTLIRSQGFKYQSAILSKLSDSQRHRVFMDCARKIITNSITVPYCSQFMLSVWNRYKNLFTETEFNDMITSLCGDVLYVSTESRQHTASLLKEIWTTAPVELVNGAVQNVLDIFLDQLRYGIRHFPGDELLELLVSVLANASTEIEAKSSILYRFGCCHFLQEVMMNRKPYHLDEILKTVISDPDKIYERKHTLMNSSIMVKHCLGLIQTGNVDKINDLMTSYLSDTDASEYKSLLLESQNTKDFFIEQLLSLKSENIKKFVDDVTILPDDLDVTDYKLELLQSPAVTEFYVSEVCTDRFNTLYEFINDFLTNSQAAEIFTLQICTSEKVITHFHQEINESRFSEVKNKVEQFIAREEDRNIFKLNLLRDYEQMLLEGEFRKLQEVQWDEFIPWCSSSNLSKFKKSLPIDDIFVKMLIKSVTIKFNSQLRNCTFRDRCSFHGIDEFLRWYFDTEDEIKEYKMDRIMNFRKIELFDMLMRKTEKYYLRAVLHWFFNKNAELIEKFEKLNSKHKICNFI